MESSITEDDERRIATFVSAPKYKRDPEMLVPDDE
ncbi:hypothetical protein C464_11068 [Halorubrum coriense DSM 10284]|uniref:Uncharacterized protein n=1 Tax=Halorubrum coriense DSM 10284 TaxID=1227466 RepID=M0EEY6_9EURY|nr:hypothetical protein C464_11068 [Halorubrum coriense DSM 10284]